VIVNENFLMNWTKVLSLRHSAPLPIRLLSQDVENVQSHLELKSSLNCQLFTDCIFSIPVVSLQLKCALRKVLLFI
jgi:hypothetical protein